MGLPTSKEVCHDCAKNKITRKNATNHLKAYQPLDLIVSDVCDPFPCPSLADNRYYVSFIDVFSGFSTIYFIKFKSEALKKFKNFVNYTENQLNRKIKQIHSDNGGEYVSKSFIAFCEDKGIKMILDNLIQ